MITGLNKIKEMEELHQIIIYEINDNSKNPFELCLNYTLPEEYRSYSKTFEFDIRASQTCKQGLLLLSRKGVSRFDFSNPSKI